MNKFSASERRVLAIVQADLPNSPNPFATIAAQVGMTEEEVLALLRRLKQTGAIRRFGASIRHQRAGWNHNAMVAWQATPEEAGQFGADLAKNPNISHAYFRPARARDWPYTFYTMVHGRSRAECDAVIGALAQAWRRDPIVLRSLRELKKTSMAYFGACDG